MRSSGHVYVAAIHAMGYPSQPNTEITYRAVLAPGASPYLTDPSVFCVPYAVAPRPHVSHGTDSVLESV